MKNDLGLREIDRIIQMAWEDRTPFEAITAQFHISENEVITIMRKSLKRRSFERWRARVNGRKTKHLLKRTFRVGRFKCSKQHFEGVLR